MTKAKTKDVSTRQIKPPMPVCRPTVTIEHLPAKLMLDMSRYSNGSLAMTLADIGGEVTADGKKVGSIYGALGGGIVVTIGDGDKSTLWSLNMKDIWDAVNTAVEEQYK